MYNLTVIGGGLGGYGAAIRAAQKGKKVLLIEKDKIGGTCLNLGCIPTKALLYSSFLYEKTKEYKRYGISVENVEYNWNEIIKFKDSIVDKLVKGVEFLLKKNRVTIIKGEAKFIGEKKISVNGENYESDYFLIATGSKPSTPPFLTKNIESNIFFSDKLFSLEKLPESIAIVGAGVIGVEAATIFSRLGKRVYLIEIMNQIIPGADKESVSYIRKSLKKKGVEILTSTLVKEINKEIEGNDRYDIHYKSGYELFLIETADYSLRYEFSFYYKELNVSSTANIRKMFSTRFKINAIVQKKAHLRGIGLGTPMLIEKVEPFSGEKCIYKNMN